MTPTKVKAEQAGAEPIAPALAPAINANPSVETDNWVLAAGQGPAPRQRWSGTRPGPVQPNNQQQSVQPIGLGNARFATPSDTAKPSFSPAVGFFEERANDTAGGETFHRNSLEKPLPLGSVSAIGTSVTRIVKILQEMHISDGDEEKIISEGQHWLEVDRAAGGSTLHLNAFISNLRSRNYVSDSLSSLGVDRSTNAFEQVLLELTGPRANRWRQLLAKSTRHARVANETVEAPESGIGVLAESLAKGGVGMVGGLAKGIAGIIDAGTWAATEVANAAGVDLAPPESVADFVGKQYDELGDLAFGRDEWSGEGGFGARNVSMVGGEVLFMLATMGAQTQAAGVLSEASAAGSGAARAKVASRGLQALDWLGKFKSFDSAVGGLITHLEAKQKDDGAVDWADPELWMHCTALAAATIGAVKGGQLTEGAAAKALEGRLAAFGRKQAAALNVADYVTQVADYGARVARMLAIGDDPNLDEAQRKNLMAGVALDTVKSVYLSVAAAAKKKDDHNAIVVGEERRRAREESEGSGEGTLEPASPTDLELKTADADPAGQAREGSERSTETEGGPTAIGRTADSGDEPPGTVMHQLGERTANLALLTDAEIDALVDLIKVGMGDAVELGDLMSIPADKSAPALDLPPAKRPYERVAIGAFPDYKWLGDAAPTRRYQLPAKGDPRRDNTGVPLVSEVDVWSIMTPAQKIAANRKFIDRVIQQRHAVVLATPIEDIREGSFFQLEVGWLEQAGYELSVNGREMYPPDHNSSE